MLAIREPGSNTRSMLSLAWPVPLERDFRLLEVGSQASVRACAAMGSAVAFLSLWVVSDDVKAGRLVLRQASDINPKRTMRLVKRRRAFPSKAISELFEALRKSAADLAPESGRSPLPD